MSKRDELRRCDDTPYMDLYEAIVRRAADDFEICRKTILNPLPTVKERNRYLKDNGSNPSKFWTPKDVIGEYYGKLKEVERFFLDDPYGYISPEVGETIIVKLQDKCPMWISKTDSVVAAKWIDDLCGYKITLYADGKKKGTTFKKDLDLLEGLERI